MKTRNVVWSILLAFSIIMAGCQQQASNIPADPVEAVKTIADKQADVKSEHLNLSLDLGIQAQGLSTSGDATTAGIANLLKNFKANLTLDGDVDNAKQDMQLTGTFDLGDLNSLLTLQGIDKRQFDLVKVGDTMYVRLAGQDWNSVPVSSGTVTSTGQSSSSAFDMSQLAALLKKVAKAEKLDDETIGGVDSYHFKVTLNPTDLLTELANIAQASDPSAKVDQAQLDQAKTLLQDSTVEVDMWVGKSDLFIRKEIVHLNLNLKNIPDQPGVSAVIDFSLTGNISKINQPVTITAPK